jgi:phospholipid/cholesterol/gamma-HCH transport system substrate-binding protein
MKHEIKVGLLGVVSLLIMIFGYKYLKGQDILDRSQTIYVKYTNIDMLDVSNPVLINGYKVGSVMGISMDDEDANLIKVTLDIKGEIKLPKNTKAALISTGVLGDKAILLEFDELCQNDCLESGATIDGVTRGFLKSMMGTPEEVSDYIENIKTEINTDGGFDEMFTDLQSTIHNLSGVTEQLNNILGQSGNAISQSLNNLSSLTQELDKNKSSITSSLKNIEHLTQSLDSANIGEIFTHAGDALASTDQALIQFESTLEGMNKSLVSLKLILDGIQAGEGTVGKAIKDDGLYERLDKLVQNMDFLLQDVRLNPKRYINVSVFGKKQKDYVLPEGDPAFDEEK